MMIPSKTQTITILALTIGSFLAIDSTASVEHSAYSLKVTFGHNGPAREETVQVLGRNTVIRDISGIDLEAADRVGVLSKLHCGAGDLDGLIVDIDVLPGEQPERSIQSIWQYLLDNTSPSAAERLRKDPGLQVRAPIVTIQTSIDGTRGFSFTPGQVLEAGGLWIPEQDAYVTLADNPLSLESYLESQKGMRVLEIVETEEEANYADFAGRWKDMGDPVNWHPDWETTWLGLRGHLVCLVPRPGSVYKFCVGRWGEVRPDHASPHGFRFDIRWNASAEWLGQSLEDGLPLIRTQVRQDGVEYELDQFVGAWPGNAGSLDRGEVPGVSFTSVEIPAEADESVRLDFRFGSAEMDRTFHLQWHHEKAFVVDSKDGRIWMAVEVPQGCSLSSAPIPPGEENGLDLTIQGCPVSEVNRQVVFKIPSPSLEVGQFQAFATLSAEKSRESVRSYWEEWNEKGALFEVPDAVVNKLFRSNIWHALRLPRYRLDENGKSLIDLPYSNTAYGQTGIGWPVNQAVYVDYMLYGLRGYEELAFRELQAIYDVQQQDNGRIAGFANWNVYTPSQVYSVAQCFLLSGDRNAFEQLLPDSLEALEWCLKQVEEAQFSDDATGLLRGALNDLTNNESAWAFNQAYQYAGISMMGIALERIGHPLAAKCHRVAAELRQHIETAFAKAAVQSPVVQLGDGTWISYVPADALTWRRMLDVWYPTDIDTGALHLARLEAIDPAGWLTDNLLNDHEDNLFLNQWGMANEPIYNQQASAYLFRDNPKAAIRSFYSMMACAFSHHQLEPVEHRWAWGQFFGPPSTDGAWFELYRRMLIREQGDILFLGQATPRAWLEDWKKH